MHEDRGLRPDLEGVRPRGFQGVELAEVGALVVLLRQIGLKPGETQEARSLPRAAGRGSAGVERLARQRQRAFPLAGVAVVETSWKGAGVADARNRATALATIGLWRRTPGRRSGAAAVGGPAYDSTDGMFAEGRDRRGPLPG